MTMGDNVDMAELCITSQVTVVEGAALAVEFQKLKATSASDAGKSFPRLESILNSRH